MGGAGSGRWYRWNTRRVIEECRRLDVRRIHRKGMLAEIGGFFSWAWWDGQTGERTGSINFEVGQDYLNLTFRSRTGDGEWEDTQQFVPLEWTPCNYGGHRPWFLCPSILCRRRVAILVAGGKRFLCRHCYRLPYASTLETRADRLLRKANKIRRRLGGEAGMAYDFPDKPKGMHRITYERLRQEALWAEETGFMEGLLRFGLDPGESLY